jgi:hypothetical protein
MPSKPFNKGHLPEDLTRALITNTEESWRGVRLTGKANLGRRYQQAADRLAAKHSKHYGVYRCPHCGGAHLTTKLENAELYEPLLYVTR